jgi:hypothetical protein
MYVSGTPSIPKIKQIFQINNTVLKNAYEAERKSIEAECKKLGVPYCPPERKFHGTKDMACAMSIINYGFDDHYFNAGGYFGRGCYFSDIEEKVSSLSLFLSLVFFFDVVLSDLSHL